MKSLIQMITEKCVASGKEYKYMDESLRFEANKHDEHAVIDFYSMDLGEIEEVLDIKKYDAKRHNEASYKILDNWYDVVSYLEYLEGLNDWNRHMSVLGYEIHEEHYIKLHYRDSISFT